MSKKTLLLLRGVSGSGKTTLAKSLEVLGAKVYAADDYHYDENGVYNFKTENLKHAHANCRERVESSMLWGHSLIVVHNTNTSQKEITPYQELCDKHGYKFTSLIVENRHGGKNVHNVPEYVLERQKGNILDNIKL